jgi:5-methylcytosine-specific restriction endonuclease McrA
MAFVWYNKSMKVYKCKICGKQIGYNSFHYGSKLCRSCSMIELFKDKTKCANYKDGRTLKKYKCKICKKNKIHKNTFIYGSGLCKSCSMKGRIISWNDKIRKTLTIHGLSRFPYPLEFKFIRKSIIERDKYKCQCCGLTQEEHFKKYKRDIEIHHIDYNHTNCEKTNLITTCKKCNINANYNRDYYYALYTYIIENYQNKGEN